MRFLSFAVLNLAGFIVGCSDDPTAPKNVSEELVGVTATFPRTTASENAASQGMFTSQEEIWNYCTEEWMLFEFRWQVMLRQATDRNGATHFQVVLNDQGSWGTGLSSGITYRENQIYKNTVYASTADDETLLVAQNFQTRIRVVAPGPGNDMTLFARFQLLLLPDGIVVVYRDSSGDSCE
jgi:hypothetical protein